MLLLLQDNTTRICSLQLEQRCPHTAWSVTWIRALYYTSQWSALDSCYPSAEAITENRLQKYPSLAMVFLKLCVVLYPPPFRIWSEYSHSYILPVEMITAINTAALVTLLPARCISHPWSSKPEYKWRAAWCCSLARTGSWKQQGWILPILPNCKRQPKLLGLKVAILVTK